MRKLIAILLACTMNMNSVPTTDNVPVETTPTELEQFFIDVCELARDKEIHHHWCDESCRSLDTSEYARFIEEYLEEQTGERIYSVHDMFAGAYYGAKEERVYNHDEYIITIVQWRHRGYVEIQNTETNETIYLSPCRHRIYVNGYAKYKEYIYGSYTNESTGKYITYQINEETMTHYYEEIINEK